MSQDELNSTDRRTFLQAGAGALAAAGIGSGLHAQGVAAKSTTLPKRPLGKTGVDVTILDQGAVRNGDLQQIFRFAFANGVRVFDTAKVYGTEPDFKKWFETQPEVRKQIFLVTKDMPKAPSEMSKMVDERLEALGTDYLDLFFLHGLGDHGHSDNPVNDAVKLVQSQEFKAAADALRKSGKVKFVGFSTHHRDRARIIQAAAEGGIVDAIMLQYTPWLDKESPLNKALDSAWKKGSA